MQSKQKIIVLLYVSLEVLERICRALRCDIGDVMELTEESEK